MTTPPLDSGSTHPAAPSLLYVVKQLELASRAHLEEMLRPDGITALQYTALTVLQRRPAMTAADLARRSFVRAQSAADLVGALERRGLISRAGDPAHRRRRLINLTPAGRDLLAAYAPQVERIETKMVAGLSKADQAAFRGFLQTCREGLS